MSADEFKAQGNAAFAQKDFPTAIEFFTKGIEVDPSNHVLYSNRSACHASLRNYNAALEDANKCVELNPGFAKGFGRKGAALHGQGDLVGALDAYEAGLKVDSSNAQLQAGLKSVKDAIDREAAADGEDADMGLGKIFSDPNLLQKIASNPQMAPLLADSAFMQKLEQIKKNPNNIQQYISDPRMMQLVLALMGVNADDLSRAGQEEGQVPASVVDEKAAPEPVKEDKKEDVKMEDAPVEEEVSDDAKAKEQADAEKAKGNAAYKSRDFATAIAQFEKAWSLHKDITYLNNLAAAYYESGDLDKCIETSEKAIDEGREIRADYKHIAKAMARAGTACTKKDDLEGAVKWYQKSLTEHRTADTLNKLRDTEKKLKEKARLAKVDPVKAEEARVKGNDLFKAGDYVAAVKTYTEMIDCAPEDARGYGNRAAAYLKLMSISEALKDCEKAVEIDPSYVKGYIRMSNAYFAMREFTKALEALAKATSADTASANTREIAQTEAKIQQAMYAGAANDGESQEEVMARASQDPEVVRIMQDPAMQAILQQMQQQPESIQEHMKDARVRANIQRLVGAGVLKMGTRPAQ
ncbi:Hsp90 cochaperone [Saitoella coloradoensis]